MGSLRDCHGRHRFVARFMIARWPFRRAGSSAEVEPRRHCVGIADGRSTGAGDRAREGRQHGALQKGTAMCSTKIRFFSRVRMVVVLTNREARRFRGKLEAERKVVEARLAARSRDEQETVRDESGVGDSVDEASLLYDREGDIDDNDLDQRTLVQIDRALRRLDEGTYGVSEVSGKPIPVERLEAVPYATTLIDEQPLEPA